LRSISETSAPKRPARFCIFTAAAPHISDDSGWFHFLSEA
jgi:hypothetical protein